MRSIITVKLLGKEVDKIEPIHGIDKEDQLELLTEYNG